mmetsp:Transcript_39135/g.103106  ORF Transcript_39135/g.103106 Transcript_39135/m.103106 type:complete len:209 (+) Transcript_39135:454-1080(+)
MAGLLERALPAAALESRSRLPRKKSSSLRMLATTLRSASLSGGASAASSSREPGGAGSLESAESAGVSVSSPRASRERASAADTTSSSRNVRKTLPSGEKKKASASRARSADSSASPCGVSRRESAALARKLGGRGAGASGAPPAGAASADARTLVPFISPAAPTSTPPRTPSTLKAEPSPSSRTATNFSSACNRSIIRSTSKVCDWP